MKLKLALVASIALVSTVAEAGSVSGYYRSNGTYVQGYQRSAPDSTVTNNYSYKGNSNPYTGQAGTNRYIHDTTSPNYQGPNSQGRSGHSGQSGYGGYDSYGYR